MKNRMLLAAGIVGCGAPMARAQAEVSKPNVVIIYADDLGWGDLSCYGNKARETPNLDRMAAEGVRLTDFYVSTPSCGPSRAALLTGRYPFRTGVPSNPAPDANLHHGIRQEETTLAEALHGKGYRTKCIGKWHLGHRPEYYPTRHGFDEYFGILYSNDMRPVMLCRDEQAVEYPVVQSYLTQRYTSEATEFIEKHREEPFFLYLPHAMPHKPLAASEAYYTPETRDDLYSDVVRELDASVGAVLDTLSDCGLTEKTLVLFSSDNGPWFGGSTGGLRGMKGSTWEGGSRVPGIFWWPGTLPKGRVVTEPCGTIDVMPTVCGLAGIESKAFEVDGYDIFPLLSGTGQGPDRAIYSWQSTKLFAVRKGPWKLHTWKPNARPRGNPDDEWDDPRGPDGTTLIAPLEQYQPWQYPSPEETETGVAAAEGLLFNLESDPGEQIDVAADHPEVVAELLALAQRESAETEGAPLPKMVRTDERPFLGPGRVTEETAISIEEALSRTID